MKIAVINETSTADKNHFIIHALSRFNFEIMNIGMKKADGEQELSYIQTGFLSAVFLNAKKVDLVIGGCGTGQGFLISAMQYPGVFCGLIETPLDAWLFRQINGGNCISLALNKGFGWGGDTNLEFIFEKFFSVESGTGYPEHRRIPQQKSMLQLRQLSRDLHLPFPRIVDEMDAGIVTQALHYPGVWESLNVDLISDRSLAAALNKRYYNEP
jgi:ribose 5-phosphate isomerase RpiB